VASEEQGLSENILAAMADGVIVTDAAGRIVYVSGKAEELTGYGRDELLGRAIEVLVPGSLGEIHERHREGYVGAPVERDMASGLDIHLRRADGEDIPVDIALSPLRVEGELRVVAVIRDVSAKRDAERRIRDQAALMDSAYDAIFIRTVEDGTVASWNQGATELYGFAPEEALGAVSSELLQTVFPEPWPDVQRRLLEDGRWEGELRHTRKDGLQVTTSSRWVVLREQGGAPRLILEINRDITEQKRSQTRMEAVLEVAQSILAGQGADQVLDLIARRARELVRASLAAVALPEEDGDWSTIRVAEGTNAVEIRGLQLAHDRSVIGRAVAHGEPVVVEDLARDPDASPELASATAIGPALYVPLAVEDNYLGTVIVANPQGSRPFSQDEFTVVQLFSAAAAVALQYTKVRETLDRMRLLADRERIGRELHDGVIQTLFSVGMSLQSTAVLSHEDEVARRLQDNISTVDQVIRDLRNYIFELRPGILRDQGLEQALRRLADDFYRQTGVATAVDIVPEAAIRVAGKGTELLPVVSEALSNVRRHAQAETCRIKLSSPGDAVVLEVEDDGMGFDPDRALGRGHGLRNFRERTQRLGAELDIESVVGSGTTVRVTIPA
jgi:PAS domain S-box-containing protein